MGQNNTNNNNNNNNNIRENTYSSSSITIAPITTKTIDNENPKILLIDNNYLNKDILCNIFQFLNIYEILHYLLPLSKNWYNKWKEEKELWSMLLLSHWKIPIHDKNYLNELINQINNQINNEKSIIGFFNIFNNDQVDYYNVYKYFYLYGFSALSPQFKASWGPGCGDYWKDLFNEENRIINNNNRQDIPLFSKYYCKVFSLTRTLFWYSVDGFTTSVWLPKKKPRKFIGLFCLKTGTTSGHFTYKIKRMINKDHSFYDIWTKTQTTELNNNTIYILTSDEVALSSEEEEEEAILVDKEEGIVDNNNKEEEEEGQNEKFVLSMSNTNGVSHFGNVIYYFRLLPVNIWNSMKKRLSENYQIVSI